MSNNGEAINTDIATKIEKKTGKHVKILDPKSPSAREAYEKRALQNGYSFEDLSPVKPSGDVPMSSFPSFLPTSQPLFPSFQAIPSHPYADKKPAARFFKPDRTVYGMPQIDWLKLTDIERENHKRHVKKASCYRTRLCRAWLKGACQYGNECNFAHGEDELQKPPMPHPKYKTMLCRNFVNGLCQYGERCQFIHKIPGADPSFVQSQPLTSTPRNNLLVSNRYVLNSSMAGPSLSVGVAHSSAFTNFLYSDQSEFMGLPGNSQSNVLGTPKREFSSSMFQTPTGNRLIRPMPFAMSQNNPDNLIGLLQQVTIPENEGNLASDENLMSSIGNHRFNGQ